MKKLPVLACILISFQISLFAQKPTYKVAIVSFYNLENLFDTIDDPKIDDSEFLPGGKKNYSTEIYQDKLEHLAEVISQIGTDRSPEGAAILGVAEIENEGVLRDLVSTEKLKSRNYKIVHYDSPDVRGIDVGLLYNPKYFSPSYSEPLFVPLFENDTVPRYTRDVLYVAGNFDGEPIHLFVNHWPSRRGGEEASAPGRAKAASVCKHKIDSITALNPDAKIFLMGDLNDDPVSPSVAKVIGAKGEKNSIERGGMFNPWMDSYKQGIGTLAYNDSWNLFDQIIVSSGLLSKDQTGYFFGEAHIFSKPWMMQSSGRYKGYPKRTFDFDNYIAGYSDHFPTFLVIYSRVK
ncbi:MAG: endonuclease [Bacteroidetes bacterium]|nr:MAG: endonuclease [Bacteroidota bacterium]